MCKVLVFSEKTTEEVFSEDEREERAATAASEKGRQHRVAVGPHQQKKSQFLRRKLMQNSDFFKSFFQRKLRFSFKAKFCFFFLLKTHQFLIEIGPDASRLNAELNLVGS